MKDLDNKRVEELKILIQAYIKKYNPDFEFEKFWVSTEETTLWNNSNATDFTCFLNWTDGFKDMQMSFSENEFRTKPEVILDDGRYPSLKMFAILPTNYSLQSNLDQWLDLLNDLIHEDWYDEDNIFITIQKHFGLVNDAEYGSIEKIIKLVNSNLLVQYGYMDLNGSKLLESYLRIWLNTPSFWKMFSDYYDASYQVKLSNIVEFDNEQFVFDYSSKNQILIFKDTREVFCIDNKFSDSTKAFYLFRIINKEKAED